MAASPTLAAAIRRVIVVTVDGMPADRSRIARDAPALAALAESGIVCDSAVAPTPWTFPAWVELWTGCTPTRTRVWNDDGIVPERLPSLAASLAAAGFHGLAMPADVLAHAGTGLARGFDRYDPASPALAESVRVDTVLAWLGRPGRRFAWLGLSLGPPSEPWRRVDGVGPREPEASRRRLTEVDATLRHLWDGLGRHDSEGTLVVVAGAGSDSGTSARVPLVLLAPQHAPRRVRDEVWLADVAPTVLALVGARAAGFDGVDLLAGGSERARAARGSRTAWRPDTLALPLAARAEAESLEGAPADSVTLAAWDRLCDRFPASARLVLERAVARSSAGSEAVAARDLKALLAARPDDARVALAYAEHLLRFDRGAIAADVLRPIEPRDPFAALAEWRLVLAHACERDFVAAERAAERARHLAVPYGETAEVPARLHRLAALRDSSAHAPRDGALRMRYGRALGDVGLFSQAYQEFHAARALTSDGEADYWLASYLLREGRPQHAEPTLRRALERQPDYPPAHHALAEALLEQGKRPEARVELERIATSGSLAAREWYNLACLRAGSGDADGALDALDHALAAGYANWDAIATDPDLDPVRSDPRFPSQSHHAR